MKSIEEKAREYADVHKATEFNYFGVGQVYGYERIYNAEITAYERGAKEQKAIDIDIASIVLCRYVCPYKIDSNKCLNSKCKEWEIFRKMMEEYTC